MFLARKEHLVQRIKTVFSISQTDVSQTILNLVRISFWQLKYQLGKRQSERRLATGREQGRESGLFEILYSTLCEGMAQTGADQTVRLLSLSLSLSLLSLSPSLSPNGRLTE